MTAVAVSYAAKVLEGTLTAREATQQLARLGQEVGELAEALSGFRSLDSEWDEHPLGDKDSEFEAELRLEAERFRRRYGT